MENPSDGTARSASSTAAAASNGVATTAAHLAASASLYLSTSLARCGLGSPTAAAALIRPACSSPLVL